MTELTKDYPSPSGVAAPDDLIPGPSSLVQFRREGALLQNRTTPKISGHVAAKTIADLKVTFSLKDHHPSPQMWSALGAVATTMEQMADGTAVSAVHLASLDPGVGKTQAVVHFLRTLLASEHHVGASVIVCVGRLEQINDLVRDAQLAGHTFAALTSDDVLNKLGCGAPGQARILFTTHSMVESRCERRAFADVNELHYSGRPRDVRIWDEAILPGRAVTLSRDDVSHLLKPLRRHHPRLAAALDVLSIDLLAVKDGAQYSIPDLTLTCGVDLNDALRVVEGAPADQVAAVTGLWFLFGKTVTVRRDGVYGNTMLDYRETLPPDIAPLLVLDASARTGVRTTYPLWEQYRGGIVRLPEAPKDYKPLTVHLWRTAGGKSAFKRNGDQLIEGTAKTIDGKLDEPWLVVVHKGTGRDIEREIKRLLKPRAAPVHFLTWGAHDATNAFADIPNIILAGTLFYRPSFYEALGRAAAGQPSSAGSFAAASLREIVRGEHRHLILQALCRGLVRKCDGASCPKVSAYIIASNGSGIADELPAIFPGARIVPWRPVARELTGKAGVAARYVIDAVADGDHAVSFAEVRKHSAITNAANFNRTIRRHDAFIDAVAEHGIIEWPRERPIGFVKGSTAYFGNETEAIRKTHAPDQIGNTSIQEANLQAA